MGRATALGESTHQHLTKQRPAVPKLDLGARSLDRSRTPSAAPVPTTGRAPSAATGKQNFGAKAPERRPSLAGGSRIPFSTPRGCTKQQISGEQQQLARPPLTVRSGQRAPALSAPAASSSQPTPRLPRQSPPVPSLRFPPNSARGTSCSGGASSLVTPRGTYRDALATARRAVPAATAHPSHATSKSISPAHAQLSQMRASLPLMSPRDNAAAAAVLPASCAPLAQATTTKLAQPGEGLQENAVAARADQQGLLQMAFSSEGAAALDGCGPQGTAVDPAAQPTTAAAPVWGSIDSQGEARDLLAQQLLLAVAEEGRMQQETIQLAGLLASQQTELAGRLVEIQALVERRDALASQVAAVQQLSLQAERVADARRAELQSLDLATQALTASVDQYRLLQPSTVSRSSLLSLMLVAAHMVDAPGVVAAIEQVQADVATSSAAAASVTPPNARPTTPPAAAGIEELSTSCAGLPMPRANALEAAVAACTAAVQENEAPGCSKSSEASSSWGATSSSIRSSGEDSEPSSHSLEGHSCSTSISGSSDEHKVSLRMAGGYAAPSKQVPTLQLSAGSQQHTPTPSGTQQAGGSRDPARRQPGVSINARPPKLLLPDDATLTAGTERGTRTGLSILATTLGMQQLQVPPRSPLSPVALQTMERIRSKLHAVKGILSVAVTDQIVQL